MTVAELYVNIGVKGAEKAEDALKEVGNLLTDLSGKGLAAKAAILGAVYGIEQLTAAGGRYGNTLINLRTYTGETTKYFQQLREAFRESGVDASEADQSIIGLQKSLAEAKLTGQAPKGLGIIFGETGGAPERMQDAEYSMGKIFEFIRNHKNDLENTAVFNDLAESMGITPGAIVTARTFGGEVSKITKNVMNDAQLEKLKKVHLAWSDFWKQLEMFNNRMTSSFGLPLISFLDKTLERLSKIEKLLTDHRKENEKIATDRNIQERNYLYPGQQGPIYDESKRRYLEDYLQDKGSGILKWLSTPPDEKTKEERRKRMQEIYPNTAPLKELGKSSQNEINTTVNMYGVENTHEGVSELERHVNYAIRQSPSQGWVA